MSKALVLGAVALALSAGAASAQAPNVPVYPGSGYAPYGYGYAPYGYGYAPYGYGYGFGYGYPRLYSYYQPQRRRVPTVPPRH